MLSKGVGSLPTVGENLGSFPTHFCLHSFHVIGERYPRKCRCGKNDFIPLSGIPAHPFVVLPSNLCLQGL